MLAQLAPHQPFSFQIPTTITIKSAPDFVVVMQPAQISCHEGCLLRQSLLSREKRRFSSLEQQEIRSAAARKRCEPPISHLALVE